MKNRLALILILLLLVLMPLNQVAAQEETPVPEWPVYIVQPGDTLSEIAAMFNVSMESIMQANGITNPNQLQVGQRLTIPGLDWVQGVLISQPMPFGETLRSLGRRYSVSMDSMARLNRVVSPQELYVGHSLILPAKEEGETPIMQRASLGAGMSTLELAVLQDSDPWIIAGLNDLTNPTAALPGDVLFLPGGDQDGPGALPPAIQRVDVTPFPFVQGETGVIRVVSESALTVKGELGENTLHFFLDTGFEYVALQGVHALAEPGLYPLTVSGALPDGAPFGFTQRVFIAEGDFWYENLDVDPGLLEYDLVEAESNLVKDIVTPATADRLWTGLFSSPSPYYPSYPLCITSRFGTRRSYNNGPYDYYHSGTDFCGQVGVEIFAPAPGIVAFAEELNVRGGATIINHGWGVYTGYWHQSEIMVHVGDRVETGQVIGLVGNTGRSTGSHLHWEVWAGGESVSGLSWLEIEYP